ncbi:MAG: chemotaxis protein CheW [Gemmatimonadales bacterium]
MPIAESPSQRVVVCRVGSERFALPVSQVREVVAAPPSVRIPGVSQFVKGLVNVRGSLVTSLSGPALLGFPGDLPANWLVVLTGRRGRVAIEVDEVEDLFARGESEGVPILELDRLLLPVLGTEPGSG